MHSGAGIILKIFVSKMYLYKGKLFVPLTISFLHGSVGKESACNAGDAGDVGSIPGLRRSRGGENGNPLRCSCLKTPMDSVTWWVTESNTTE